jgi:outer membrane protein assembly factor BamB
MNGMRGTKTFFMAWASLLMLLVPYQAAPATKPDKPEPVKKIRRIPAWDVTVIGKRILVLEKDFLHVSAWHLQSGKRLWKRRFQKKANGTHRLYATGKVLFVYAGNKLFSLDPRNGKTHAVFEVPFHVSPQNRAGCYLDISPGVCALSCDCLFQFLSCLDGAVLGPRYSMSYTCMHDHDGEGSAGCFGPQGRVLGRTGELWLATVEDTKSDERTGFAGPQMAVAVNPQSGQEVWRTKGLGLSYWNMIASGISPDNRFCWLGDLQNLAVFECQTGKILWKRGNATDGSILSHMPGRVVGWNQEPAGIFQFVPSKAGVYQADTGEPVWEKEINEGDLALLAGMNLEKQGSERVSPDWSIGSSRVRGPRNLVLLNPADGSVLNRVKLGEEEILVADRPEGFLAIGKRIRRIDRQGVAVGDTEWKSPAVTAATRELLVGSDNKILVVIDRRTGDRLASFEGTFSVKTLEKDRLVVYRHEKEGIGAVIVYSVSPLKKSD